MLGVFLVGVAMLAIGIAGSLLAQSPGWIRFFDNMHWTAGTLTAALLGWWGLRAARGGALGGVRWMAVGLAAYAAGQILWDVQTLVGYSAFPSPSDLFYLWLGPCMGAGLLGEIWRRTDRIQRTTLVLDATALSVAVMTVVLVQYLPRRGDTALLPLTVLVAYPVTLLTALCIGLIAIPTLRLRVSWSHGLLLVSLAVTGASWMLWNARVLDGASIDGAWFNGLFSISVLGMGIAVANWRMGGAQAPHWERRSEGFLRILPLAAVILAGVAVVASGHYQGLPGNVGIAVDIGALLVIALAVVRQSTLLREYDLLKSISRELEESEHQKRLVLRSLPDLVWLKDAKGAYQMCNPIFERFFGAPEAQIRGKTDFDFVEPELARRFRERDREAMAAGEPSRNEQWVTFAADGRRVLLETVNRPLRDKDGRIMAVLGIARDITERDAATRQLALVDFALNHVMEAAYLADEEGRFQYVNDEACRALGLSREALLDLRVTDVDRLHARPEQWRASLEQTRAQKSILFESVHARTDGSTFPVEVNANYFEFGGRAYVLGLVRDITERKQAEEQIRNLAYFDPLTRLPNRRMLMDRLGQALLASRRTREFGALLMLDLDHFKTLNDTQGHDVGDRLLVEVAQRLGCQVRKEDTVARLGGDEFVVMLEGLGPDENHGASQAEGIAEKIRAALNDPYALGPKGAKFHSTTSIGLTLFRGADVSVESLLKQADLALYQAKDAGRNAVRFFNPAMQAAIDARTKMEVALRRGLEQDEFRVHYQPQVDDSGRIIGAEALARWAIPGQGLVSPAEFIPLAEETDLIIGLGRRVLETACAQLHAWAGDPRTQTLEISVNVSARQFHSPAFVASVRECLAASGCTPARLKLELTESVVLHNVDEVVGRMRELNALGIRFCLDDFGTGYSSLSYLKRLPLHEVKIDRSFVRDLTDNPSDAAIVRAILAMSDSLGLHVIAEGVETEAQRTFLLDHGCVAYQGFLFGRPMPVEQWAAIRG
jgi:diguanylate cyclase (GGDEF)-like protein/PAS domain S-box-containing protein